MKSLLCLLAFAVAAHPKTILVVTADALDFVTAAGGAIAGMTAAGDRAVLLRVANDDKNAWDLSPEQAAARTSAEVERAARALGIEKVISLGYREGELGGVSPTELRDRIAFHVRVLKPDVMFIPNPYAEYVEQLDRHYAGLAAEEARHTAALRNHQPPLAAIGVEPHVTRELYYYAQPVDPRRREPEASATFVPQPKVIDIESAFAKKLQAARALKTIQTAAAMRIRQRLESTGRRLPLLDTVNDDSVNRLVEIELRGLASICSKETPYKLAEEFHYSGPDFQVPAKLRR